MRWLFLSTMGWIPVRVSNSYAAVKPAGLAPMMIGRFRSVSIIKMRWSKYVQKRSPSLPYHRPEGYPSAKV